MGKGTLGKLAFVSGEARGQMPSFQGNEDNIREHKNIFFIFGEQSK